MNFNPEISGFIQDKQEERWILVKDYNVVAEMFYANYAHGLSFEWRIVKIVHKARGEASRNTVFEGAIPDKEFGEMLIENLRLTK